MGEGLKDGPFQVGPDVVALVTFDKPDALGDLGVTLKAGIMTRDVPPVLVVAALRQLADTIEMNWSTEGQCPCGESHD